MCTGNRSMWLTHRGRDIMAAILQMIFSHFLSLMEICVFEFICHWNMFAKFQLTVSQHRFWYWLSKYQVINHYLILWRLQWVKCYIWYEHEGDKTNVSILLHFQKALFIRSNVLLLLNATLLHLTILLFFYLKTIFLLVLMGLTFLIFKKLPSLGLKKINISISFKICFH